MKALRVQLIAFPLIAMLLTGCDGGAECGESCHADDDCESNALSCVDGECVPSRCEECKYICNYTRESDDYGHVRCTFNTCF